MTILNLCNSNIRRNFIDLYRSSTNRRKGWWNEISINIDKYSLRSILFLFLRIIYFSQRQLWICLTEKSWEIRLIEGKEKNSSSILKNYIHFSQWQLWTCLTEKNSEIQLIEGKENDDETRYRPISTSILDRSSFYSWEQYTFFSMSTLNLFKWEKFRDPTNQRKRKKSSFDP